MGITDRIRPGAPYLRKNGPPPPLSRGIPRDLWTVGRDCPGNSPRNSPAGRADAPGTPPAAIPRDIWPTIQEIHRWTYREIADGRPNFPGNSPHTEGGASQGVRNFPNKCPSGALPAPMFYIVTAERAPGAAAPGFSPRYREPGRGSNAPGPGAGGGIYRRAPSAGPFRTFSQFRRPPARHVFGRISDKNPQNLDPHEVAMRPSDFPDI